MTFTVEHGALDNSIRAWGNDSAETRARQSDALMETNNIYFANENAVKTAFKN